MSLTKLSFVQLEEQIPYVLKAGEVPFIQGMPGIGKSAFWRHIANKYELLLIDVRLTTFDPTFFNGFLWVKGEKAAFKPLDLFPLQGETIPVNPETGRAYKGWIIHLDEFTQPPKAVEGAAFQLVLDRMVGDKKIHDKAFIVCSGNPQGKGMIAKALSLPMRSRLIHFEMVNSVTDYIETAITLGHHSLITSFLQAQPKFFNTMADSINQLDGTYACERSWQKLSNIVKQIVLKEKIEPKHLPLLIGAVGESAGQGFYTFVKSYYSCPDIQKILADPFNTPIPDKLADQYACLSYLVENTTTSNGSILKDYILRFKEEFQLIFGKILLKENGEAFDANFKFLLNLAIKYANA